MLEVSVSDNGCGIRKSDMSRFFKHDGFIRASRTEQGESGIGLGLYICRKIVRSLGGDIVCQSDWGISSTFTYCVKLMPQSLETEERPQRIINPVTQRMFPRFSIQD